MGPVAEAVKFRRSSSAGRLPPRSGALSPPLLSIRAATVLGLLGELNHDVLAWMRSGAPLGR